MNWLRAHHVVVLGKHLIIRPCSGNLSKVCSFSHTFRHPKEPYWDELCIELGIRIFLWVSCNQNHLMYLVTKVQSSNRGPRRERISITRENLGARWVRTTWRYPSHISVIQKCLGRPKFLKREIGEIWTIHNIFGRLRCTLDTTCTISDWHLLRSHPPT